MKAVPALTDEARLLLCKYMHEKFGVVFDPSTVQGFAVINDDGKFVAGVLVSNVRHYNGTPIDCEISCASDTPVAWSHDVCRAVFTYVFGQLGCIRCTSITRKNNDKSRKFLEALNFALEGRLVRGYDGKNDALIYGLLAENCQFFGGLNG